MDLSPWGKIRECVQKIAKSFSPKIIPKTWRTKNLQCKRVVFVSVRTVELITKKQLLTLGSRDQGAGDGAQESAGFFFLVIILVALSGSLNSAYM